MFVCKVCFVVDKEEVQNYNKNNAKQGLLPDATTRFYFKKECIESALADSVGGFLWKMKQ